MEGPVSPENSVMVSALPVFRFVVNGVGLHLHLAGGQIALEVGAVVHRVPEAELHKGEELHGFPVFRAVFYRQLYQQTPLTPGDEEALGREEAVLFPLNAGVAQAVAAAVGVQFGLHRLPAGIPDRIPVLYVDVEALLIRRAVVVAVTGDSAQARVFIKAIAPRRVGEQGEKIFAAQVVDPGKGRPGRGDDVLPPEGVKVSELHRPIPPCRYRRPLSCRIEND